MTASTSARDISTSGAPAGTVRSGLGRTGIDVELVGFTEFAEVWARLDGLEGSTFQSPLWLSCWYETFKTRADITPFLVIVSEPGGQTLLALPLIRRQVGGLQVFESPDLGVTDYAAPLVRRSGLSRLPPPSVLWEEIKACLAGADLLHLERLPPLVAGMPNPLFGHPAARKNRLSAWQLPLGPCWQEYFRSLSPKMQEKLKKMGRKFGRAPMPERHLVTTVPEALAVLADLERLQAERIGRKGLDYHLDQPAIRLFYRRLVEKGLPQGRIQMTVLRSEGKTIAANFAAMSGNELIYLRVANEFGDWARHALGLLVTEFAVAEAQKKGVRTFDFTMGNYDYKRRFGAVEMPLEDLVLPLGWRGWPNAIGWHIRHWASRSPMVRRICGKLMPEPARDEPGQPGCHET